jgi:RNA polymerase sigma factor (sigma-70 family)
MALSERQIQAIFAKHHKIVVKAVSVMRPEIKGITAEDVEQEVSIRLLKLIKSDREIKNLSSYIYKITANIIIDLARKNQKLKNEMVLIDENDQDISLNICSESLMPDQQSANEQQLDKILAVIEMLPDGRRVVVKLRLQGFTIKEISHMTGWSYYKTENFSKRGMTDLRSRLKDLGIEYEIN